MTRQQKILLGFLVVLLLPLVIATSGKYHELLAAPTMKSMFSVIFADRGVTIERGIAFGPHQRDRLDIYRPVKSGDNNGPIAFFIYGGGWHSGDRATYGFVGNALAARGITTVIADYRLYPEVKFPAFVDDAARAYAWIFDNLAKRPGNSGSKKPRPIFLMGHSAGAHSAALLAFNGAYLRKFARTAAKPAGLIGLAGPYAFDPTTWPSTRAIFASAAGRADEARPISFVGANTPPALLMHGRDDKTVRLWNTRNLAKAIRAQGGKVTVHEFEGIGHAGLVLAISKPLRWRAPVLEKIVQFIKAVQKAN